MTAWRPPVSCLCAAASENPHAHPQPSLCPPAGSLASMRATMAQGGLSAPFGASTGGGSAETAKYLRYERRGLWGQASYNIGYSYFGGLAVGGEKVASCHRCDATPPLASARARVSPYPPFLIRFPPSQASWALLAVCATRQTCRRACCSTPCSTARASSGPRRETRRA